MKKLLLAGVAALFLATGAAHAQEMDLHHGDNTVMLMLEKADGQRYVGMLNTQETCTEVLEMLGARSKAGKDTWITLARGGKPERILNVICVGTPTCPAAAEKSSGKAC